MTGGLRLKDQPASERPRERLAALGPSALSQAELIAILLRTGLKGMNAVEVGKQLLARFGSLQALAVASVDDLRKVKGIGRDKAVTLVAAFALAQKMAAEFHAEAPLMDTPEAVVRLLREENRLLYPSPSLNLLATASTRCAKLLREHGRQINRPKHQISFISIAGPPRQRRCGIWCI